MGEGIDAFYLPPLSAYRATTMPSPTFTDTTNAVYTTWTEVSQKWQHAVRLFAWDEYHLSAEHHRSLLRKIMEPEEQYYIFTDSQIDDAEGGHLQGAVARLWFNYGIIKAYLGECQLAYEALARSVALDKSFGLATYALGIAAHLIQEHGVSQRAFHKAKQQLFGKGQDTSTVQVASLIDGIFRGTAGEEAKRRTIFAIDYTRVDWNERMALIEKAWMSKRVSRPGDGRYGINGLPKMACNPDDDPAGVYMGILYNVNTHHETQPLRSPVFIGPDKELLTDETGYQYVVKTVHGVPRAVVRRDPETKAKIKEFRDLVLEYITVAQSGAPMSQILEVRQRVEVVQRWINANAYSPSPAETERRQQQVNRQREEWFEELHRFHNTGNRQEDEDDQEDADVERELCRQTPTARANLDTNTFPGTSDPISPSGARQASDSRSPNEPWHLPPGMPHLSFSQPSANNTEELDNSITPVHHQESRARPGNIPFHDRPLPALPPSALSPTLPSSSPPPSPQRRESPRPPSPLLPSPLLPSPPPPLDTRKSPVNRPRRQPIQFIRNRTAAREQQNAQKHFDEALAKLEGTEAGTPEQQNERREQEMAGQDLAFQRFIEMSARATAQDSVFEIVEEGSRVRMSATDSLILATPLADQVVYSPLWETSSTEQPSELPLRGTPSTEQASDSPLWATLLIGPPQFSPFQDTPSTEPASDPSRLSPPSTKQAVDLSKPAAVTATSTPWWHQQGSWAQRNAEKRANPDVVGEGLYFAPDLNMLMGDLTEEDEDDAGRGSVRRMGAGAGGVSDGADAVADGGVSCADRMVELFRMLGVEEDDGVGGGDGVGGEVVETMVVEERPELCFLQPVRYEG